MAEKYQQNVQKNTDLEDKLNGLNNRIAELMNEKNDFLELASHELKSPLRKIATFADMLEKKLGAEIPGDAQNYLQRIRKNIITMQSAIDGITELNSINCCGFVENCDLNEVLAETLTDLSGPIAESRAIIQTCALPLIEADFSNMKRVFYNILNNSIKYRKKEEIPRIDITVSEPTHEEKNNFNLRFEKKYYKIKFADNGIGFSQKHSVKVFEPFVQLNGKNEFHGNGLGLAICRKIVDQHRGIIYAESDIAGSSFSLILPQISQ